jgi:hypothetical protein
LGGIVAPGGSDPADERAQALNFRLHIQSGLEQQIEAGDSVAFEGQAIGTYIAVRELDDKACAVFVWLGVRVGGLAEEAEGQQAEERYEGMVG